MPKVLFREDSGPPLEQLLLQSKVSMCEVNLKLMSAFGAKAVIQYLLSFKLDESVFE